MARGPNDNKIQTFAEDKVDEIVPIYENLSNELIVIVGGAITQELTLKKKREAMAKVDLAINKAAILTRDTLGEILPESYLVGVKVINDGAPTLSATISLGPEHSANLQAMLDDAFLDFGTGLQGAKKSANTILSRNFQEQIRSRIVSGVQAGRAIPDISADVLRRLTNQGFTTFIRKDGGAINLKSYSEMLTRTHVIRGTNEGTLTRAAELGINILEMSSHPGTEDAACLEVEGELFDLTGKEYPKPPTMPIHPNCRHQLFGRPDLS